MKNTSLFYLLCCVLFLSFCTSCNQVKQEIQNEPSYNINPDNMTAEVEFAKSTGLFDYQLHPENVTWEDIYQLYLKVDSEPENKKISGAFKQKAIAMSINDFGLLSEVDENSLPVIAYYAEELNRLEVAQPESNLLLLESLSSFWDNEKISAYAKKGYEKSMRQYDYLESEIKRTGSNSSDEENVKINMLNYTEKNEKFISGLKELSKNKT